MQKYLEQKRVYKNKLKYLSDLRDRYQNVTISDKGKVFNTELIRSYRT
jgi:succinate dehydrogenase/fumarate reductase flavoprotein subunit